MRLDLLDSLDDPLGLGVGPVVVNQFITLFLQTRDLRTEFPQRRHLGIEHSLVLSSHPLDVDALQSVVLDEATQDGELLCLYSFHLVEQLGVTSVDFRLGQLFVRQGSQVGGVSLPLDEMQIGNVDDSVRGSFVWPPALDVGYAGNWAQSFDGVRGQVVDACRRMGGPERSDVDCWAELQSCCDLGNQKRGTTEERRDTDGEWPMFELPAFAQSPAG